jgi:hypothetical protein
LEQQKLWKLQKTEYKNWRKKQMSKKLEKEIEELKKRIEELEGKQPKPEPAKLPFWMPEEGEPGSYFWGSGDIGSTLYDQQKIAIGNYFKTEELAQKHVDKLKLLEEIKQWRGKHDPDSFKLDWEDEDSDKWELVWNVREALWDLKEASDLRSPLGIYFSFDANIHYFLEHFGKRLNILLEVD